MKKNLYIFLLSLTICATSSANAQSLNIRLKSEANYSKQLNQFVQLDTTYYNYPNPVVGDEVGNYFSEYFLHYRDSANLPLFSEKQIFQYDANLKDTTRTYLSWDGTSWIIDNKWISQYNASGNLTQSKKFEPNQGGWKEVYRITQTYNSSDFLTERLEQEVSGITNTNKSKRLYTRDGLGRLTEFMWQNWSNNTWVNYNKTINVFSGANTAADTVTKQDWFNNAWRTLSRDIYSYTTGGLISERVTQNYNTNTSTFINATRNTKTYNAASLIVQDNFYTWIGSWRDQTSMTYTTYTGNYFGRLTVKQWNGTQLENSYKVDQVFNQDGWRTKARYFDWINAAWVENGYTNYEYEQKLATDISSIETALKVYAYPNPFINNTIVEFDNALAGEVAVQIVDLNGRKVLDNNFYAPAGKQSFLWEANDNNGALPKGIFFMQIKTPSQQLLQKLIKQ